MIRNVLIKKNKQALNKAFCVTKWNIRLLFSLNVIQYHFKIIFQFLKKVISVLSVSKIGNPSFILLVRLYFIFPFYRTVHKIEILISWYCWKEKIKVLDSCHWGFKWVLDIYNCSEKKLSQRIEISWKGFFFHFLQFYKNFFWWVLRPLYGYFMRPLYYIAIRFCKWNYSVNLIFFKETS